MNFIIFFLNNENEKQELSLILEFMNQLSPTLNNCFTVKFQQEIAKKKPVKFKRNWKILISKRELVVKLIPNKIKKVSMYHFFAQRPGCLALKWFCLFTDLIYCKSITQDKL